MYDDTELTDESHEIRISINCANRIKPRSESKLIRFFQNISRFRLHSRHIGYYSPRAAHSIDAINVRQNPVVVVTNNDAHHVVEQCADRFAQRNHTVDSSVNNSISNSSKDDNGTAIKDELTAYMEEVRLRNIV